MQRKIAFRAWYPKKKKMFYNIMINGLHLMDGEMTITDGLIDYGEYVNTNQAELMQFTGLHDKNGKEIFEGDILDFENGYISEIHFSNACFLLNDGMHRENLSHGKIIGNIYQNPELLEGESL